MEGPDLWSSFDPATLVILLAFNALFVVPMARIFLRAGFSWAWGLVCFIPGFGVFVAWILLLAWRWSWRDA